MNMLKKLGICAVASCGILSIVVSSAQAQRDAGAKARGEFGLGWNVDTNPLAPHPNLYGPVVPVQTRTLYSYQPLASSPMIAMDNRQSYSHQAVDFAKGDKVVITSSHANIAKGEEHIATLNRGETFEVRKVEGEWLGVVIDRDGKRLSGWVNRRDVAHEGQQANPNANTRQSFSLEPVAVQPVYVSPGYVARPHHDPSWTYSKADPRRYETE